jgi:hypothetical protein
MYAFAKNARAKGKYPLLPFQNGIMLSVNSLKSLYADLKEKYGLRYILTCRLNQDVLENFFSFVRSMVRTYDHPSPVHVKYRLCLYSLGKNTGNVSDFANTLQDTDICLSEQSTVLICDSTDTSQQQQKDESQGRKACLLQDELCLTSQSSQLLFPDVTEDTEVESNSVSGSSYDHLGMTEENITSHEGLLYIAAYIAYRTKNKYNLGAHTFKIKPEDDNIMQP